MILDKIILKNFGVYYGEQVAVLTPNDQKPIVLFGGLNGGGKTTLLDAIQLAFYGPKARVSNRGRQPYKDYLRNSIHRGVAEDDFAEVSVHFRRMIDGMTHNFELTRRWSEGKKGIEETVSVLRDNFPDEAFTDHWDEVIEAYLPSSIAHLFFFDGEQIMELAEGGHAAEILGTAIHSLLGLDLVDRIDADLKVFERRKRAETLDESAAQQVESAQRELERIDCEQERLVFEEGALANVVKHLAKAVRACESKFRSEGGELFQQRGALQNTLAELRNRRGLLESEFRELVSGPLPLLIVESQLAEIERRVRHETDVRHAKALVEVLEERDTQVLALLRHSSIQLDAIKAIGEILNKDRKDRHGLASEPLVLEASGDLAPQIGHLRGLVLPSAEKQTSQFINELANIEEQIARVQIDLARVPPEDRIAILQAELDTARRTLEEKEVQVTSLKMRIQSSIKLRATALSNLNKLADQESGVLLAKDDRERILRHSQKARDTLARFRIEIVKRHVSTIESLMLESFQQLLRKASLVTRLTINPDTFEPTLFGRDGDPLPVDRLSAGERQLLATSMLWGLARASGRPLPTVIDTPLGRLDSDHRANLIDRYFPNASHQVLLLSTDEEIVNGYLKRLEPFVAHTYRLEHDEERGRTTISKGYFPQ